MVGRQVLEIDRVYGGDHTRLTRTQLSREQITRQEFGNPDQGGVIRTSGSMGRPEIITRAIVSSEKETRGTTHSRDNRATAGKSK